MVTVSWCMHTVGVWDVLPGMRSRRFGHAPCGAAWRRRFCRGCTRVLNCVLVVFTGPARYTVSEPKILCRCIPFRVRPHFLCRSIPSRHPPEILYRHTVPAHPRFPIPFRRPSKSYTVTPHTVDSRQLAHYIPRTECVKRPSTHYRESRRWLSVTSIPHAASMCPAAGGSTGPSRSPHQGRPCRLSAGRR